MKKAILLFVLFFGFVDFSFADENKTEILIVYYSRTGNTKLLAEAVAEGANEVKEVDLHTFDPAVRNHCKECDEFSSRFADISFGGSGAVQQNSMLLIRTETGQKLINNAIIDGYVKKFVPTKSPFPVWKENKLKLLKRMTINKVNK